MAEGYLFSHFVTQVYVLFKFCKTLGYDQRKAFVVIMKNW